MWFAILFVFAGCAFIVPALMCFAPPGSKVYQLWTQAIETALSYKDSWSRLMWRAFHIIFYFVMGLASPCFWKESFTLGTLWELVECTGVPQYYIAEICLRGRPSATNAKQVKTCGSYLDLLCNAIGITIGVVVRQYLLAN